MMKHDKDAGCSILVAGSSQPTRYQKSSGTSAISLGGYQTSFQILIVVHCAGISHIFKSMLDKLEEF